MGILGLSKLISDIVPTAVKESEIKHYFGRKVAIDASMSLYQFLIAVRSEGAQLTSADGETTSHLMGTFYRTIRLVENGIKPVFVFDGKPPELKSGELSKRQERRQEAQKALEKAEEAGDSEQVDKFSRRLVKVTRSHADDCKKLLTLMGVPYVEAPCEAEAQCAALVKAGKVYATATEDMDALTFGSNILLRHMTFSEARKMPIQEFHLSKVLEGLELNKDQFIDLCILLGCDYCDSIRGIGPKRAIELMQQHGSLEKIMEKLDLEKYKVPEKWPYQVARRLFQEPEITDPATIEEGLVKYLCEDKGFKEERVRNGAKKLSNCKSTATQGRLEDFFKVLPSKNPPAANGGAKRKADDKGNKNKKGKTGGGKFKKPK
ncbi:hypothetical protein B566_EDAN002601 [Ephemera danica]|nr:hypothetical protein B566_EDAN002601 [Ephemera danica]